jgi:N-methylhydantoinase A/oxoprolinase/acetone carboxylase beta subunit
VWGNVSTFTDVTVLDLASGAIQLGKTLSTPDDLVAGILHGIEIAARKRPMPNSSFTIRPL